MKKETIIVCISAGEVTAVHSETEINVIVLDYDAPFLRAVESTWPTKEGISEDRPKPTLMNVKDVMGEVADMSVQKSFVGYTDFTSVILDQAPLCVK